MTVDFEHLSHSISLSVNHTVNVNVLAGNRKGNVSFMLVAGLLFVSTKLIPADPPFFSVTKPAIFSCDKEIGH